MLGERSSTRTSAITALKMKALKWNLVWQCHKRHLAVTRMHTKHQHSYKGQHSSSLKYVNQMLTSWVRSCFFRRAETYQYMRSKIHTHALNEQIVHASNKKILEISLTCLFFKKFNKGVVFLAREYIKQM